MVVKNPPAAVRAAGGRPFIQDSTWSLLDYSLRYGPNAWQMAIHELLGSMVYRWRGML